MGLNFEHKKGDTFEAVNFAIKVDDAAIDLTDARIRMQLKKECGGRSYLSLTTILNAGLTITDALLGKFKINKQVIDIESGKYIYDIEIKFADNSVKTWINGEFIINCEVTE